MRVWWSRHTSAWPGGGSFLAAHGPDVFSNVFLDSDGESAADEEEGTKEVFKGEDEVPPFHVWVDENSTFFPDWQKSLWPQ